MHTHLNGADKENAPQPVARHIRGTSKFKHPKYKPTLRNYQAVTPRRDRQTIGRSFRPFGNSEVQVEVLTESRFPAIRISTIDNERIPR